MPRVYKNLIYVHTKFFLKKIPSIIKKMLYDYTHVMGMNFNVRSSILK